MGSSKVNGCFLNKTIFFAALLFCAVFAVAKPIKVKAAYYSGSVSTSSFSSNEEVYITGDTTININSNVSINRLVVTNSNKTVTITGDAGNTLTCGYISTGAQGCTLKIESGKLVTTNYIFSLNIEINGGTVESSPAVGENAITVINSMVIRGGSVKANGSLCGIVTEDLTITGGSVEAEGGTNGIYASGTVSISGENTTVKAKGGTGKDAIIAESGITISSPLEVSSPASAGISSDGKFIATEPGGTVHSTEAEIKKGTVYTITVGNDGHGSGTVNSSSAVRKTVMRLTATADSGYEFDEWTSESGISFADSKSANTTFIMPTQNVTVRASFKKISPKKTSETHDDPEPSKPSNTKVSKVPDGCDELRVQLSKAADAAKTTGKAQTVYWSKGTSLPYDIMSTLHNNPLVTLVFSYTYMGQNFAVTIPGSLAYANPAVEWYGPVYLYALYGNMKTPALTNTTTSNGAYTVKSGDSLSAIAKRLGTTVKRLKQLNNIRNADRIKPGMVLRY